ncbi:MAG: hypothetical protein WBA57_10720 [Elainellaceae cyanobacterium]
MSSDADRAIAIPSSGSMAQVPDQEKRRQPMQIYRPPVAPLPGNRPVADNVTEETDNMLEYLD